MRRQVLSVFDPECPKWPSSIDLLECFERTQRIVEMDLADLLKGEISPWNWSPAGTLFGQIGLEAKVGK
jgi:hypothetical protein